MRYSLFILLLFIYSGTNAQHFIIAHRGASYLSPENTLAAVNLAWELEADAAEVDVHLTKDNRIMVIHDKTTKRTCSGKKNLTIKDSPSMLLRDLDAGSWKAEEFKGEKIPYLDEVIETVPEGKILVVEIKCDSEIIPALAHVVEKSGKGDQLVFICFDWKTILNVQEEFPDNRCYWLKSSKSGLERKMAELAERGLAGVNLKYSAIDKEVIDLAEQNGLEVLSWTVDDPVEAKRLGDLGVKGITTNRPKWLQEQLKQ